jgi:hypothetical protein
VEKESHPSQESSGDEDDVREVKVRSLKSCDATWHGSSQDVSNSNIETSDLQGITQNDSANLIEGDVTVRTTEDFLESERKMERKLGRKNFLYQQLTKERKEQLGNERVKSLMLQNKDRENLCRLNIVNTRKGSTKTLLNDLPGDDEVIVDVRKEEEEDVQKNENENAKIECEDKVREKGIENDKDKDKDTVISPEVDDENEKKLEKVEDTIKYPDINGDKKKEMMMLYRRSVDRKYGIKSNARMTNYLLERADSVRIGSRTSKRTSSDLDSMISDLTEDEENERDLVKKIEMKFIEIGKRIIEVHNRQNSLNDTCKKEFMEKEKNMKIINDKKLANVGKNSCHKNSVKNRKIRNYGFFFRAAPVDDTQLLKNIAETRIKEENALRFNIDVEKRTRLKKYTDDEKIRKKEFDNQIRRVNERGAEQVKDLGIRLDLCRKRAEEKNRKNRSDIERLLRGLGHLTATLEKQRKNKEDNTDCEADSSKRYSSSMERSSIRAKSHRFSRSIMEHERFFFTKKTDSVKINSKIQNNDDVLHQEKSQSDELLLGQNTKSNTNTQTKTTTHENSKLSIFKKSVYDFFTRIEIHFFKCLK